MGCEEGAPAQEVVVSNRGLNYVNRGERQKQWGPLI